jgi:hypothetical protein
MRKIIASLLFFVVLLASAQENQDDISVIKADSAVYTKTTAITEARTFTTNIKEKYAGKDFEYTEETKVEPKKTDDNKTNNSAPIFDFLSFLGFFMSTIFPFLLGGFVIYVIVKVLLGSEFKLWNKTVKSQKMAKKLIYEDEDIHDINVDTLLQQAIANKDFRLAIRYYYLSSLKTLSNKQVIDYHKDKTNSDYLFEIENTTIRTNFSYLSYVYSYVWYGEFPVDETSFKVAENKYQSFLKSIG